MSEKPSRRLEVERHFPSAGIYNTDEYRPIIVEVGAKGVGNVSNGQLISISEAMRLRDELTQAIKQARDGE